MPKRALLERRPWLLTSLIAAIAYYLLIDAAFPGVYLFALQAGSLLLLAVYAILRHTASGGYIVAAIMGLSGFGAVAFELNSFVGIVLFAIGHTLAIGLYLTYRRESLTVSQIAAAVALFILTPLIFWRLPIDRGEALTFSIYGLLLGAMAATAWTSAFPRYRVGLGALLYVGAGIASIAQTGPLVGRAWPEFIIWPLFYLGHFLICTGIIQTLRGDQVGQN